MFNFLQVLAISVYKANKKFAIAKQHKTACSVISDLLNTIGHKYGCHFANFRSTSILLVPLRSFFKDELHAIKVLGKSMRS